MRRTVTEHRWALHLAVALFCAGALGACSVPIASGLDEPAVNRAVVALEQSGVVSAKEPDPQAEGHWQITVARDDALAAVVVLTRENLPAPAPPGVLAALGQDSIVPSRTSEQAKLLSGISGELERSLLAVDGVLSARVHLAVPAHDTPLIEEHPFPPTASVLLRHRGATPPIATADIQRLVAGALPGLTAERVSVVSTSTPAGGRVIEPALIRFGPMTVTRSSMSSLRWMVSAALLLNLALCGLVAALWMRMRRAVLALLEARKENPRAHTA